MVRRDKIMKKKTGTPGSSERLFGFNPNKSRNTKYKMRKASAEKAQKQNSKIMETNYGRLSLQEASDKYGFKRDRFYYLQRKYPTKSPVQILNMLIAESLEKEQCQKELLTAQEKL